METTEIVGLKGRGRSLNMSRLLAPLALVIIYAFFAIFGRNYFSYTTLVNILDSSYYIGFIAIGVTFVIITGGIDLSCGTSMMVPQERSMPPVMMTNVTPMAMKPM